LVCPDAAATLMPAMAEMAMSNSSVPISQVRVLMAPR